LVDLRIFITTGIEENSTEHKIRLVSKKLMNATLTVSQMRRKHYGRIQNSVTLDLKEIANEFTARNERHTDMCLGSFN